MASTGSTSTKWESLAEAALNKSGANSILPRITLPKPSQPTYSYALTDGEVYGGPGPWDRSLVEAELERPGSSGNKQKVLMFSSNDLLGLGSHPAVRKAAAKAAMEYGMSSRGSSAVFGQTEQQQRLEAAIAGLTKKEDCIVCPTGSSATNAVLSAIGTISTLLANGGAGAGAASEEERVAVFCDASNHASVQDGVLLLQARREVVVDVYRHNDMNHLDYLLSNSRNERKVVFTDSLFGLEGDFAPMLALTELRKRHGFLLVVDDAYGTLVCGRSGGGIAQVYGIEHQVDICLGSVSKATGCIGGFIACSNKWKQLIQANGRQYIHSTALPVPVLAATLAAVAVAKKEPWRRRAVWSHIQYFNRLTGLRATSPIVSLPVGSEEAALQATRQLLECGFHVVAVRTPPAAAASADEYRLRVTLTAAHTRDDIHSLVNALSHYVHLPSSMTAGSEIASRL